MNLERNMVLLEQNDQREHVLDKIAELPDHVRDLVHFGPDESNPEWALVPTQGGYPETLFFWVWYNSRFTR